MMKTLYNTIHRLFCGFAEWQRIFGRRKFAKADWCGSFIDQYYYHRLRGSAALL